MIVIVFHIFKRNESQFKRYVVVIEQRVEGVLVDDFYGKRFGRKSSPFSPKFQYPNINNALMLNKVSK